MQFKHFKLATLCGSTCFFSANSFADITVYNGQHKEADTAVAKKPLNRKQALKLR